MKVTHIITAQTSPLDSDLTPHHIHLNYPIPVYKRDGYLYGKDGYVYGFLKGLDKVGGEIYEAMLGATTIRLTLEKL